VDARDKRKRTVTRGKNHAAKKVQASQGDVHNVSTEKKKMKRDSVALITGVGPRYSLERR
jgi:hypothetical protein